MGKKKNGFNPQKYDVQSANSTEHFIESIDKAFSIAVSDFSNAADKANISPDKPFDFKDYPTLKTKAKSIVATLADRITNTINTGTSFQWEFASKKNDFFLESILKTSELPKSVLEKYQDRNLEALKSFQARKTNGLNLSDRVWNYTNQFQKQMELGIDIAVGDGRSAQALSKDLRQYLIDPDKLFRRVRDKHGNLKLSKNAELFNPGVGKYRSSYKNAMRLARTEINMAYRESDQLRWNQLDFVVGFEVRLSNNHTLNGVPFVDICDDLKGKYPKEFKFKGWHPQCRCHAIPILQDPDEFNTDELNELKAAINGTEYNQLQSRNAITDVPQGFKEWINTNAERSKGWKSQPYFIKDNFKGGTIEGGLRFGQISRKIIKGDIQDIIVTEKQAIDIVNKAIEDGKEVLYRGDTRDKGNVFDVKNTDYKLDGKIKNEAGFNFFTDKKAYATDYATTAMNESIRVNAGKPNITIVEIDKGAKLFDFNKLTSKQAAEFEIELNKMQPGYLDRYRSGVMNDIITLSEKQAIKKYPWLKGANGDIRVREIINHPQTYSDFELGVTFKKYLQENGYDGFVFQEYKAGAEYGFIDKKLFKVIAKYFIKNE
jgi:hypothetical protein